MPALRISLRDRMIALVAATLPEYAGNISPSRLDKIDKVPAASVYLEQFQSVPGAMRGHRQRTQPVTVSLFASDATDVEAKLSDQLNELEKAVEAARQTEAFADISSVYLESGQLPKDPDSAGKDGEVHASFVFTYTESLA